MNLIYLEIRIECFRILVLRDFLLNLKYHYICNDILKHFQTSGALIVSPCFEASRKFDEVIKVTCKLLIELPHGLDDSRYKILKQKLILLIKQLEFRKPYFSAAGFYEVNYGMFMYIFGGVTSFVVVYLQLQNKI